MTIIAGSALHSEVWDLLYTVISGNIVDPASATRSSSNKKFIYTSFPDTQKSNFPGFPVVVINPVQSTDSRGISFGFNDVKRTEMVCDIEIFTTRNADLDTIHDDVHDAILTKRADMSASGLNNFSMSSGGMGTDVINNNQRIHFKTLTVGLDFNR